MVLRYDSHRGQQQWSQRALWAALARGWGFWLAEAGLLQAPSVGGHIKGLSHAWLSLLALAHCSAPTFGHWTRDSDLLGSCSVFVSASLDCVSPETFLDKEPSEFSHCLYTASWVLTAFCPSLAWRLAIQQSLSLSWLCLGCSSHTCVRCRLYSICWINLWTAICCWSFVGQDYWSMNI